MTTVTAYTKARSDEMEAERIVSAYISGDNLIFVHGDATETDAGNVRGPIGNTGAAGDVTLAQMTLAIDAAIALAHGADTIHGSSLAPTSVTGGKLENFTVTATQLGSKAVTTAKIDDDAVGNAQLADNAVRDTNITNGHVKSDALGAKVVTTPKIDDKAVGTDQIADDAVTATQIADDAVMAAACGFIFSQSATPPGVTGGIWIEWN